MLRANINQTIISTMENSSNVHLSINLSDKLAVNALAAFIGVIQSGESISAVKEAKAAPAPAKMAALPVTEAAAPSPVAAAPKAPIPVAAPKIPSPAPKAPVAAAPKAPIPAPAPKAAPKPAPKAPAETVDFASLDEAGQREAIKTNITRQTKNGKTKDVQALLAAYSVERGSELPTELLAHFNDSIERFRGGETVEQILASFGEAEVDESELG